MKQQPVEQILPVKANTDPEIVLHIGYVEGIDILQSSIKIHFMSVGFNSTSK